MPGRPIMPQHHAFVKKIAAALRHRCGVGKGSRLIVAVSGGADSVALLRALCLIAPRRRWELTLAVGHVQHHLRGEAAESDAAFVTELAGELELPLLRGDLDPNEQTGNLESRVRRMRYRALAEMAQAFDAPMIATAHHGDDQLETLVMRLLRGASAKGMGAMAWHRRLGDRELIRPMLGLSRQEVHAFLREIDQPWREDHTNADVTRLRARLRRDVLPVLHDLRPDSAAHAAHVAEHFRDIAEVVEQAVERAADRVTVTGNAATIDRIEARQLPRVVLAGLFRRLLCEAGIARDRLGGKTIGPIVRAIRDHKGGERRFSPGMGVQVSITRRTVQVVGA